MANPPSPPRSPASPPATKPRHDNNAAWDADEDTRPDGDPAAVKDEGVLESLGKAISAPIVDADSSTAPIDPTREGRTRAP